MIWDDFFTIEKSPNAIKMNREFGLLNLMNTPEH